MKDNSQTKIQVRERERNGERNGEKILIEKMIELILN